MYLALYITNAQKVARQNHCAPPMSSMSCVGKVKHFSVYTAQKTIRGKIVGIKMSKYLNIKADPAYALNDEELLEEKLRSMPLQKPGYSKQNYGTPWEFIQVVERRFGKIVFDLAAEAGNAKCENFFAEKDDSLSQPWAENFPDGVLWINPPFKNIKDWAKKCAEESLNRKGLILLLVPASVGSNWFAEHVHNKSMVLALSPRLVFEGETASFPKDLMLCCYGSGFKGFDVWRWKQ
jgi:phage N-6-adenine-methyltransferase